MNKRYLKGLHVILNKFHRFYLILLLTAIISVSNYQGYAQGENSQPVNTQQENQPEAEDAHSSYEVPFFKNPLSIKPYTNSEIKFFINYYHKVAKNYLSDGFKRMEHYYPIIKEIFEGKNIPLELILLPLVINFYREDDRTQNMGEAGGLWHIQNALAKTMGLTINAFIDERLDIEKSTRVFAKFMLQAYKRFKSWEMALAAYFSGMEYMEKMTSKYRTSDFWEFKKKEGSAEIYEFIPKFIAVLNLTADLKKYGFPKLNFTRKKTYTKVFVEGNLKIIKIAQLLDLRLFEISKLNPQLLKQATPPGQAVYPLKVPVLFERIYDKRKHLLKPYFVEERVRYVHYRTRVMPGDTINKIALRHRVHPGVIMRLNRIYNPRALSVGRTLILPTRKKIVTRHLIPNPMMRDARIVPVTNR